MKRLLTTEQITAIAGTLAAVGVPLVYRIASKAGREIRALRAQLEAALRYIYLLRKLLAARGVPESRVPKPPKSLIDTDIWSDWTGEGGGDENGTVPNIH